MSRVPRYLDEMRAEQSEPAEDVADDRSDHSTGAIMYAVMFAAYLFILAVLAICSVNFIYFFAILLAGFPVSGIYLSMVKGIQARKQALAEIHAEQSKPEPVRTTNAQGYDVIEL